MALGPTVIGSDANNGLITSTIAGFQTPTDPTPTPQNADSPAQVSRGMIICKWWHFHIQHLRGRFAIDLRHRWVNGGDVIHGSYLISQNPVDLGVDDIISFSWKGEVTDNAYDAFAHLLDADSAIATQLLDIYGNSTPDWSMLLTQSLAMHPITSLSLCL